MGNQLSSLEETTRVQPRNTPPSSTTAKQPPAGPIADAITAHGRGDFLTELQIVQSLANQGDATAEYRLGLLYANGQGVQPDAAEATKWLQKAADHGEIDAQQLLGSLMFEAHRYADALPLLLKAADQGNVSAEVYLSFAYSNGRGVTQDYKEAARWARKAAEQGNAEGQRLIGYFYQVGRGVLQDYTAAVDWWVKAAEQGNAEAQFDLGAMYANGFGVPHDYVRAYIWFNLAASNFQSNDRRDTAIKDRDGIAAFMTAEEIAEAQKLAREWKPN